MTPAPVSLFGVTDVGRVRQRNEDSLLACTLGDATRVWVSSLDSLPRAWEAADADEPARQEPLVLAVADGVGGGPGGQEASRLALASLPAILREAMDRMRGNEDEVDHILGAAVLALHQRLVDAMAEAPELQGMATTLTVWIGVGSTAYLVQVGDSRCYRFRDGALVQLTHDQTMAQDMVDQGLVEELAQAPRISQNILTSALGGTQLNPRIDTLDRRPGDLILVCSDGVMKHISDQGIETWLGGDASPREMARGLVNAAVEDGGLDNVSAIVAREGG